MGSSYPPSYALMVTFEVDGSFDVFFNIHGFPVCHSNTSQSIRGRPWTSVQTVEVVFGLPVARSIKFWASCMSKKYKMADAKTRGTCVSHPSFNETITWIFEKGESHFRQIQSDLTRKQNKWLHLFVLTQLHSSLYSAYPSISLSLSSYTVKPEKQTINCKGHFIAQLADQCTPIMGVSFASGVLPVSIQRPWLSILCGARHSCYVYCFLNRLAHYDALHRTLNECVLQ